MTTVKIAGRPYAAASGSLEAQADWLFNHPGGRVIGVIELVHRAATTPAADVEKDRSVEVGISMLELATHEQEEVLRKACRALYLQRTAVGTLDPDGEVEMSEQILKETVSTLALTESVRVRAGLDHWADYARRAFTTPNLTHSELLHELDAIATGLRQLTTGRKPEDV